MAKKKAAKVEAEVIQEERAARPVRLDLAEIDHDRLETQARKLGLSKSSYARMAVLERIKADEARP
jgi:hypothetical protein